MNSKKIFIFIFSAFCVLAVLNSHKQAKAKKKVIGNFKYTYSIYDTDKVWITNITPLSGKSISTLRIPAKIGGKNVNRLGMGSKDDPDGSYVSINIFGYCRSENDGSFTLKKIAKRVKKINKIIVPKTVTELTVNCFLHVQNGKVMHIPAGTIQNVERLCEVKWKRLIISPYNKKYKVKNGVLISKNGKKMYGTVISMKKLVIPDGVKKFEESFGFGDKKLTDVYIPTSLDKIGYMAFSISRPVKFHVSKTNQHYVEANGCVYSKKTGRLVVAYVPNSNLVIPKQVTYLNETSFAAKNVKQIEIPSSVKKIGSYWCKYEGVRFVFKGKTPPDFCEDFTYGTCVLASVPKGCKKTYQKAIGAAFKPLEETKLVIKEK